MNAVQIAGVAIIAVVIVIGVFVSRSSVKSSIGPRERVFARRVCAATWILITTFIVTAWYLPHPVNWIASVGFVVGIPWAIYRWTTQRQLIRELDARQMNAHGQPASPNIRPHN